MNERAKITASHLARQAIVYLRPSSTAQVEHNRKSTDRQYALAAKARELGWLDDRITVIDEDLGLSGSGFVARSGFARLTAEVAAPTSASSWGSRSHALHETMLIGTASLTSAALPTRLSAMPTAFIIQPFLMTGSCLGSRVPYRCSCYVPIETITSDLAMRAFQASQQASRIAS